MNWQPRVARIEKAAKSHKARHGIYGREKKEPKFVAWVAYLMNGVMVGAFAFVSLAYRPLVQWENHHLLIATDPSRQILDPGLKLTPADFKQIDCLARNAYFEAATQGEAGMKATMDVVFNRERSGLFPDGACQVIYQKVHGTCQFSWYCEAGPHIPRDADRWRMANETAYNAYLYYLAMPDLTGGAQYYHADYVHPDWSRLKLTTKIGAHLFYKPDPGRAKHRRRKHRRRKHHVPRLAKPTVNLIQAER